MAATSVLPAIHNTHRPELEGMWQVVPPYIGTGGGRDGGGAALYNEMGGRVEMGGWNGREGWRWEGGDGRGMRGRDGGGTVL